MATASVCGQTLWMPWQICLTVQKLPFMVAFPWASRRDVRWFNRAVRGAPVRPWFLSHGSLSDMNARDEINRSRAQRSWSLWHMFDKQDTWVSGLGFSSRTGSMFGGSTSLGFEIFWRCCVVILVWGGDFWKVITFATKIRDHWPPHVTAHTMGVGHSSGLTVTIATEVFHVTKGEFRRSMDLPSRLLRRVGKHPLDVVSKEA